MVAAYRRRKRELGRQPHAAEMLVRRGVPSKHAYEKRWGTWNRFLAAIGERVLAPKDHNHRGLTKESLARNYRKIERLVGRAPTRSAFFELSEISQGTYYRRYGTWAKFIREMGETPVQERNLPRGELVRVLRRLRRKLGRPLRQDDIADSHMDLGRFIRAFGSWRDAVRVIGDEPVRRWNYSREELIRMYRKAKKALGRVPSVSEMTKAAGVSTEPFRKRWGTWTSFVRLVGDVPRSGREGSRRSADK